VRKLGVLDEGGARVFPPSANNGTKKKSSIARVNSSIPANANERSIQPICARGRISDNGGTASCSPIRVGLGGKSGART